MLQTKTNPIGVSRSSRVSVARVHALSITPTTRAARHASTSSLRPHQANPLKNKSFGHGPVLPGAPKQTQQRNSVKAQAVSDWIGWAIFFAPGLSALVYAYIKGKGNLTDGLSRLLTDVSQGYFQPDVGGKNIPVSQGELSDLAGDEPLFKALYKWWVHGCMQARMVHG